jgi:hypothetical protein
MSRRIALRRSPIVARILAPSQLIGAGCLSILLSTTVAANASQLVCRLYSAKDATELLETIKISVDKSGQASVWRRWEAANYASVHMPEKEENQKVIAHWMSTERDSGTKFSVVVIESRTDNETFPPEIYFINWEKARFAQVNVPYTYDPAAQISTRWQCNRVD